MSPSKKPQTPIRFPPHVRARLDAEAARLGVSINTVVVMYLDRHLPPLPGERHAPPTAPAEPPPAPPAQSGDEGALDFD